MAEHNLLTGASLHEPKGADNAAVGETYVADGVGSGSWDLPEVSSVNFAGNRNKLLAVNETEDGIIYVDSTGVLQFATDSTSTQSPSGLDSATQVEFGGAAAGADASITAPGLVTFATAGSYRINASFTFGRSGATGVAELMIRAMVDGAAHGNPKAFFIENADHLFTYQINTVMTVTAAQTLAFEFKRCTGGNNSGGLVPYTDAGAGAWGTAPSATIAVLKTGDV